jgi:oligosaccharyltransferase complex subunit delta (ribophorin II)
MDKYACSATVSIVQATAAADSGAVVLSNVALTAASGSENVEYSQTTQTDKWDSAAPGYYNVRFSVSPSGGEKFKAANLDRITRKVKVLADVKPTNVAVWASDSAKSAGETNVQKATFPGGLSKQVTAEKNQYLYADIGLTGGHGFQPSQIFLQLNKKGQADKSAVFPAAPSGKKDDKGHFLVKVNLASTEFLEAVYGKGEYEMQAVIGDSLLVKSHKWKIGVIQLNIDESDSHKDAFAEQADIAHKFRDPERRPPAILAYVFTGLILAALIFLIIKLMASGSLDLQLPSNPSELMYALGFQATLGAILVLYVFYWWKLNIFQALGGLAIVGSVATVLGNQALKRRHLRTQGKEKKSE